MRGSRFTDEFATVGRRLGNAAADYAIEARAALSSLGITLPEGLAPDDLARITMLLEAAGSLPGAEFEALATECYRYGDSRERCAVLRTLPYLPEPRRFVALAASACRTHVIPIFEAIACDNAYPALHFPAGHFNQMVLRVLYSGFALDRIVNLDQRLSKDLARMARSYEEEQRNAGRKAPPDIERLYALAPADKNP